MHDDPIFQPFSQERQAWMNKGFSKPKERWQPTHFGLAVGCRRVRYPTLDQIEESTWDEFGDTWGR